MEQLAAQSSHERLRRDDYYSSSCAARGGCLTRQQQRHRASGAARAACAPYARAAFLFILLSVLFVVASQTQAQSGRRRAEPAASPAPSAQRPRRAAPTTRPAENLPGQPATPDAPSTNLPVPANDAPRPQTNEPATAATPAATTPATTDDASVEIDEGDVVRVTSNLVPVSATVTDTRGKAITDLTVEDFELRVDGQPKPIGGLSHAETPVRMVMLFDNSDSIRSSREFEKQAAMRFFKSVLRPVDQAAIYSVGTVFDLVQPLTSDVQRLVRTIEHFDKPEGATKLMDAMAHAAEYLRLMPGRKVLVIVSDGADTISDLTYDEVLRRIIAADCQVYAVQTGIFENANLYDLMAVRRLETFSDRTGGAVYIPKSTAELDAAFAQISADLAQQYVLSYYPTDEGRDGRYRVINLRVKTRPNLRVRARRGYYPRVNGQQLSSSSLQPERFVNASSADVSSVSDASPSATRELASNSRSVIKFGGPAHGSKNMNPDTSGDAPARAETDVRVSPIVKPPDSSATRTEKKAEPETSPQNSEKTPESKPESPPEPTPDAEPSRDTATEPKPTPTPAHVSTPTKTTAAAAPLNNPEKTSTPTSATAQEPPQPSAQNAPQSPPNVGQLNSKAVSLPRPLYPETARRMRIEGAVRVVVTIDASGRVVSARADSGPLLLREAAVLAARQARFTPALVSGQPAPVSGFITYTFSL
ncbi:MAG TPA: VWA domain-containing protein [Pyrinomonadaceae bacterium]|nr:VWA domain-containing protein [Pyrinomonadaceae bacterium]